MHHVGKAELTLCLWVILVDFSDTNRLESAATDVQRLMGSSKERPSASFLKNESGVRKCLLLSSSISIVVCFRIKNHIYMAKMSSESCQNIFPG